MYMNYFPFVSALLVARNEVSSIQRSLLSFITQTYPKNCYEIIVIDGLSTDGTTEYVQKQIVDAKYSNLSIRLINNPKLSLAAGWNIGIREAKGDYVIRIDAHAEAFPSFIERSIETMNLTDAVCVGGKLISLSLNGNDNVISKILSSPFGVGNSTFRVADSPCYSDTAVYGLYRKDIFKKIGYFDEEMLRNQDIELHYRIKKAGYKFFFNPQILSTYFTRNTLKKMLKQAYGNGYWNMVLLKKGCLALSIRHLVPFAFVLFLIAVIMGGLVWKPLFLLGGIVLCIHLLLGLYFATKKTNKIKEIIEMPWLYMLLHLAYGIGYLVSIFNIVKQCIKII